MTRSIAVFEPQCAGQEHSAVNAALIAAALAAYPEDELDFWADGEHLDRVREVLHAHADQALERIRWNPMPVALRSDPRSRRWRLEESWCRRLAAAAAGRDTRFAMVTSVTGAGLLFLKPWLFLRPPRVPVLALLHQVLALVERPQSRLRAGRLLNLEDHLRTPHPPRLRYLVLGDFICENIGQALPGVRRHFAGMDLPCFWARNVAAEPPQPLRFGFLGVASQSKGFPRFCEVAAALGEEVREGRCEFALAGHLGEPSLLEPARAAGVLDLASEPLDAQEYARRVARVTYGVWAGDPRLYRLSASASFLDLLSHVKPALYGRAPAIEHYLPQMGDIGYLCESTEDMIARARELVRALPAAEYDEQCEHILTGRRRFEPEQVAPRLREIVEGVAR